AGGIVAEVFSRNWVRFVISSVSIFAAVFSGRLAPAGTTTVAPRKSSAEAAEARSRAKSIDFVTCKLYGLHILLMEPWQTIIAPAASFFSMPPGFRAVLR